MITVRIPLIIEVCAVRVDFEWMISGRLHEPKKELLPQVQRTRANHDEHIWDAFVLRKIMCQ